MLFQPTFEDNTCTYGNETKWMTSQLLKTTHLPQGIYTNRTSLVLVSQYFYLLLLQRWFLNERLPAEGL